MPLSMSDALNESYFHVAGSLRKNGECQLWRRNGSTQTWKTRPTEYRIPVKNGLKNFGYITHTTEAHLERACTVVPVRNLTGVKSSNVQPDNSVGRLMRYTFLFDNTSILFSAVGVPNRVYMAQLDPTTQVWSCYDPEGRFIQAVQPTDDFYPNARTGACLEYLMDVVKFRSEVEAQTDTREQK